MKSAYICALLIVSLSSNASTQSVDEEGYESIDEGSGKYFSDDEDIEGSALPRDSNYATTLIVHPRFTQSPVTRLRTSTKHSTIMQTQRVTTFATSTPHSSLETIRKNDEVSSLIPSTNATIAIVGVLVLIAVILVVCFFKCRTGRTNAYTPGQHRSSAALLNTQQSR